MTAAAFRIEDLSPAEMSRAERLAMLPPDQRAMLQNRLSQPQREALKWEWGFWARPDQIVPDDVSIYVRSAGRGSGKTREGAEWARRKGPQHREGLLIGANPRDARDLMLEGRSGIVSVTPPWERPVYEPTKLLLRWPNGAIAHVRSAEDPAGIRGLSVEWIWCIPAGEMVETERGKVPIEQVTVGERVWTRQGLAPVTRAGPTRVVTELVRIVLADGRSLRCTPEHKVWADGRWMAAQDVTPGSIVWAWTNRFQAPPPSIPGEACAGTEPARATTRIAPANSSIASSPESRIRRSTSTTSTLIRATTSGRTWNPSHRTSTEAGATLALVGHSGPPSGGATPRRRTGSNASPERSPVATVERPSSALGCEPSSAVKPVGMPMRVLAVERNSCPATQTYDLTVPGPSEFVVGGMLAHNCDEIVKWRFLQATWDQSRLALREGTKPQTVVTTTPMPLPLIKKLLKGGRGIMVRPPVSTYRNFANLSPDYLRELLEMYEGTRLGDQELHAMVLDDVRGAIWNHAEIEGARWNGEWIKTPTGLHVPAISLRRRVVGVDPSGSTTGDEWGIVVVGTDGRRPPCGFVLDDRSMRGSPEECAREAVHTYWEHACEALVVEINYGGEMVERLIRAVPAEAGFPSGETVRVEVVRAGRGQSKYERAVPIHGLFEQNLRGFRRFWLVGVFKELEGQMTTWIPPEQADGIEVFKSSWSPDRMDAMVWAALYVLVLAPRVQARTSSDVLTSSTIG